MSEMIERVSKAILECPNASDYETLVAKRAIEAMREPTDAMMLAAEKAEPQLECFLAKEESPSYLIWQAMIDETLK